VPNVSHDVHNVALGGASALAWSRALSPRRRDWNGSRSPTRSSSSWRPPGTSLRMPGARRRWVSTCTPTPWQDGARPRRISGPTSACGPPRFRCRSRLGNAPSHGRLTRVPLESRDTCGNCAKHRRSAEEEIVGTSAYGFRGHPCEALRQQVIAPIGELPSEESHFDGLLSSDGPAMLGRMHSAVEGHFVGHCPSMAGRTVGVLRCSASRAQQLKDILWGIVAPLPAGQLGSCDARLHPLNSWRTFCGALSLHGGQDSWRDADGINRARFSVAPLTYRLCIAPLLVDGMTSMHCCAPSGWLPSA